MRVDIWDVKPKEDLEALDAGLPKNFDSLFELGATLGKGGFGLVRYWGGWGPALLLLYPLSPLASTATPPQQQPMPGDDAGWPPRRQLVRSMLARACASG